MCRREAAEQAPQGSQQDEQEDSEVNNNQEKAYIGETSKSLPTRIEDHLEACSQAMRPGQGSDCLFHLK